MAHVDNMDKIVSVYFAGVTNVSFSYKKTLYMPKPLKVSPLLLRGVLCPEGCGGCCARFSLDYLPAEKTPVHVTS